MAKEILFYTGIYSFTVEAFINKMKELDVNEDVIIRLNSPGGSVFAGWGMINAIAEHKGKVTLKVEGAAASMGFIFCLYADKVEALDVASFMVHRADMWVSSEDDQNLLDSVNQQIRSKIEKKIDSEKLLEITGVSIKDIFESENRRDLWLSAKDAKKIGLVDQINRLDPKDVKAFSEKLVAFSGIEEVHGSTPSNSQGSEPENKQQSNNNNQKENKMTKAELLANHSDIYNEIVNEGIIAERKRCKAFLSYKDIDLEASIKAINEGTEMDACFMAEMQAKSLTAKKVEETEKDSPKAIQTDSKEKTVTEKEVEAAEKLAFEAAGLKTEVK